MTTEGKGGSSQSNLDDVTATTTYLNALTALEQAKAGLRDAQSAAATAELDKVVGALNELKLPEGPAGTLTIEAGASGTLLLRDKLPLFNLVKKMRGQIPAILHADGWKFEGKRPVMVSQTDLDMADAAQFDAESIETLIARLESVLKPPKKKPTPSVKAFEFIGPAGVAAAGIGAVGSALQLATGIAGLFRRDRTLSVFTLDDEAASLLETLPSGTSDPGFDRMVLDPANVTQTASDQEARLDRLLVLYHQADNLVKKPSAGLFDAGKPPAAGALAVLQAESESANKLLQRLHPQQNPDNFRKLVRGLAIWSAVGDRPRIVLTVKARVTRITEKGLFNLKVTLAPELQVNYRVTDPTGSVVTEDVVLAAGAPQKTTYKNMPETGYNWPPS